MSARSIAALGPEARYLFRVAGPAGDATPEAPSEALEWSRLVGLAQRERATSLLHAYVKRLSSPWPGDEPRRNLHQLTMVSDFRMRLLAQRLQELLRLLASAGIRVVLLKGAALGATAYGDFAKRPMVDVDILVAPDRAQEAWTIATTNGWRSIFDDDVSAIYSEHHHLTPLCDVQGAGLGLEIHTALFPAGHPFAFDMDALWSHAHEVNFGNADVLVPSVSHLLLHLSIHFAWSHLMREGAFRAFRDLHTLMSSGTAIDWAELERLAIDSRAATCCYWTFRLARAASGVMVPAEVMQRLAPSIPETVRRRLERYYLALIDPPATWDDSTMRLQKFAWTVGMQPARSGHGEIRPWRRDEAFDPVVGDGGLGDAQQSGDLSPLRRARQLLRELRLLAD
jgi:hypothetical protein